MILWVKIIWNNGSLLGLQMEFVPQGSYKVFSESQIDAFLSPDDPPQTREELETLYLVELLAKDVRVDLQFEYFFQTEDWVWYSPEFLDLGTYRPFPKDPEQEKYVLIREEDDKVYKHYLGSDRVEPASDRDMVSPTRHPVNGSAFLVVFYLHYCDFKMPLMTPAGPISLCPPAPYPAKLRWKEYVYWD